MREWRNWQTRTFEGRVVNTVRVQVPFLAPKKEEVNRRFTSSFFSSEQADTEPRNPQGLLVLRRYVV